jgi:serine phosphatase RsbU (regulator of sigma subunit)
MPVRSSLKILFGLLLLNGLTTSRLTAQNTRQDLQQQLETAISGKLYPQASEAAYTLGRLSYDAKDIKAAKDLLLQSITLARKADAPETGLAPSFLLGTIYFENRDFSNAAEYFNRSARISLQAKDDRMALESLKHYSKSLAAANRYKKAIEPLEKALAISINLKATDSQLACYELLETYYRKSGNTKKAEEYINLRAMLNQWLERENVASREVSKYREEAMQEKLVSETKLVEQSERLRKAEDSIKTLEELSETRQLEIGFLSKDRELANLRIQEQQARLDNEALARNFFVVIILLGSAFAGMLVLNYRKKLRTNKKIDLQNKNIKSSINYAKRIQEAMLPKKEIKETLLSESFILFKPRDVVSGDFYWFSPLHNDSNSLAFAAIDCTGHGVPGAFMSMIGMNSLNAIINRGVKESNEILEALHREIRNALQQEVTGNNDGMDAALCIYRKETNTLEFSGAKNPLVYVQRNQLHQIKGDIHSIGGSRSKPNQAFRTHSIDIESETMLYLFTDGFRDQFGGADNQKFMGKRFSSLLLEIHQLPMDEQMAILEQTFESWKGAGDQTDDVLVIGIKLPGPVR